MDKTINLDNGMWGKTFKRNDQIIVRKIADEFFLVPIKGNLADMRRIYALNPVAEYIWKELDESRSLQDICNNVVSTFDVNKQQAQADICELIREMLEEDLIVE